MEYFSLVKDEKFQIDVRKLIAIEKQNYTKSELIISPEIHEFIIENINSKILIGKKRYGIHSYLKILLDENSNATIQITDLNGNYIFTLNKTSPIFENKIYGKKELYLISDIDSLLYIYYPIKNNSRNIIYPENKEGSMLLFGTDCSNDDEPLEYTIDFGFQNYTALNLNLKPFKVYNQAIKIIDLNSNKETKIQKGINYFCYFECKNDEIKNYYSGFYEKSNLIEGSLVIEKNKYINIYLSMDETKKNIYYQFMRCEGYGDDKLYIKTNSKEQIEEREVYKFNGTSFEHNLIDITLFLKGESFFNFYRTKHSYDEFNAIKRNAQIAYTLKYSAENKITVIIIPKYEKIDFEFYFIMDTENKTKINPLNNKCYMKKVVDSNNSNSDSNIIVKKIVYKNGNLTDNIIDLTNIKNNTNIYCNVLGKGKIFDDIEDFVFYEGKSFKFVKNESKHEPSGDGGEKEKINKSKLSAGAIVGIVLGCVAFILIVIFIIIRIRKKKAENNIEIEENRPLVPNI